MIGWFVASFDYFLFFCFFFLLTFSRFPLTASSENEEFLLCGCVVGDEDDAVAGTKPMVVVMFALWREFVLTQLLLLLLLLLLIVCCIVDVGDLALLLLLLLLLYW